MVSNILVSAAIIRNNNKILIAQRFEKKVLPGLWEFPGGKIENGETPEIALQREIKEELSLNIQVIKIADVITHREQDKNIIILFYYCIIKKGIPLVLECCDYQWIDIWDFFKYPLAPADFKMVQKIMKGF